MIHTILKENAYFDSVTLMLFSSQLNNIEGVEQAAVMMGTEHNKELMKNSGVLTEEIEKKATSNDLIIGIRSQSQSVINQAIQTLNEQFENKAKSKQNSNKVVLRTLNAALKHTPESNFAIVSIPGRFAKNEVMKCLRNNLHVLLFSDNVSIEDENELKNYAVKHQLLMMGPDCGTAIINGVSIGFANVVKKGHIGLVAASGTGLQEVTVIVDRLGGGISQAIGTGGRDLKEAIGGKMMLMALEALHKDENTHVIGMISKPPSKAVLKKILDLVNTFTKPVVACFLGAEPTDFNGSTVYPTETLEEAAHVLVTLVKGLDPFESVNDIKDPQLQLANVNTGRYIRGIYTGGTLAYESILILKKHLPNTFSNISSDPNYQLKNVQVSVENTIMDMGDDFFTNGRPHPMIDPTLRSERLIDEVKDPETAIILLDCVIGYGSHNDPANELINAINKAMKYAQHPITLIASVCGTAADPQNRAEQESKLRSAGIIVMDTNAQAARLATRLIINRLD
jgi:FdrA protein